MHVSPSLRPRRPTSTRPHTCCPSIIPSSYPALAPTLFPFHSSFHFETHSLSHFSSHLCAISISSFLLFAYPFIPFMCSVIRPYFFPHSLTLSQAHSLIHSLTHSLTSSRYLLSDAFDTQAA